MIGTRFAQPKVDIIQLFTTKLIHYGDAINNSGHSSEHSYYYHINTDDH